MLVLPLNKSWCIQEVKLHHSILVGWWMVEFYVPSARLAVPAI